MASQEVEVVRVGDERASLEAGRTEAFSNTNGVYEDIIDNQLRPRNF